MADKDREDQAEISGAEAGAEAAAVTRGMLNELRVLIIRGRRRWKTLIILESLGLAVAAPLAYLWLVFFVDNVFHFPIWGRALANILFVVCTGLLVTRLVRNWRRAAFSEDEVALAIEKRTPGDVQNRLINAVQFSRESATEDAMRDAVVSENYRFLKEIHLQQSTEGRPAMLRIGMAVLVICAGLAFWAAEKDSFTNAASRIFLPFADINPVYRTVLHVSPGDVTAAVGDRVAVEIRIEGAIPDYLLLLTSEGGEQESRRIPLDGANRVVTHAFESVRRSLTYSLRGGDFATPYFRINVPMPLDLKRMIATLHFPEYTVLEPRRLENVSGDLEALIGTRAKLSFAFNQPVTEAAILLKAEGDAVDGPSRLPLLVDADGEFAGELILRGVTGYCIETRLQNGNIERTANYRLRVTTDEPPDLRLTGIREESDVMIDEVLALSLNASDDYGLVEAGVFYRHATAAAATNGNGHWTPVRTWTPETGVLDVNVEHAMPVGLLDTVEGDAIEVAARARDNDPLKAGLWLTGPRYTVMVTSPGAELQLVYEQILKTEKEIRGLISEHQTNESKTDEWITKLDPLSGLRWDDQNNLAALAAGMQELAANESELRRSGTHITQTMVPTAGDNLRLSIGMLADTEMVRCIRILEKVPNKEHPQEKRSALADARLTQQRIVRSLSEVLTKYEEFRRDWELSHMSSFTEMMAMRQERMADASLSYVDLAESTIDAAQCRTVSRRQTKLRELAALAQIAFRGMAKRKDTVGQTLADSFLRASQAFDTTQIKTHMLEAGGHLLKGKWQSAEPPQRQAAESLNGICADLLKAQKLATREALADLEELAKTSLEAQKAIEQLQAGTSDNLIAFQDGLELEEIIHFQKMAEELRKRHELITDTVIEDYFFEDAWRDMVAKPNYAIVDVNTLKLGDKPSGDGKSYPNSSDREANEAVTSIQEQFEDLVGDLLEEADDLKKDYETYNINSSWGCADPGTVGKAAGDINGTGATSTTGNMKPPTINVGGASRAGRMGARAHGLVVGDELINRRGRDTAQEGQQELADQGGEMKEVMSDDAQKDASTGIGGKLIKSAQTHFSEKDAGEWDDKIVEKLQAPQAKNQIVERKGPPLSAEVAELMRDLGSNQDQVIERIKAIKKELDQLYLPTDHLDEIMQKLQANLDRLAEKPDPDIFREQMDLLDKLKSVVVVFNPPTSDYEQSLHREQVMRGRILDEPASPTIPGYEDAVSLYYEKLSGLGFARQ